MIKTPPRTWRIPLLLALTLLLAVPLWQFSSHTRADYYSQYLYDNVSQYFSHVDQVYNNTLYRDGANEGQVASQFNFSSPCDGFPDTSNITLVMKTGATEAYSKIPTQLLTSLQCIPDVLMFSDIEQQIGQYHLYNALDRVDETIKKAHKEFELYETQQRCPVSQEDCTKDMSGGWDLDKYKFLNMIERTWEMRPNQEWYVFAEADTYVIWSNLVYWLRVKAPREELYVGSVAMINGFPFAHGGSGYVVSGSMVKKMVESIPNIGSKYDERATHECCGDLLISLAVDEAGGKVKQAHPMFNGEKPSTLPYGPGHWCEPLLTMHHMNSEEVSMVWQYEQTRTNKSVCFKARRSETCANAKQEIIQIKDIYRSFMQPHLKKLRLDWDNLSDDTCYIGEDEEDQNRADKDARNRQVKEEDKNAIEKRAHTSPAACARVCESAGLGISDDEYNAIEHETERGNFVREKYEERRGDDEFTKDRNCFQWRYHKGACCTAKSFKLGKPRKENSSDKKWTSGWFVKGIEDWIKARGECKSIAWKEPR